MMKNQSCFGLCRSSPLPIVELLSPSTKDILQTWGFLTLDESGICSGKVGIPLIDIAAFYE